MKDNKGLNTDNLIERILMAIPDADVDRILMIAPNLRGIDERSLEQKIEYIRRKINKKKGKL